MKLKTDVLLRDREDTMKYQPFATTMTGACRLYGRCKAPICPLNENSYQNVWFIGSEFCWRKHFDMIPFIRRQKELAFYRPPELLGQPLRYEYLVETVSKLEGTDNDG